PAHPGFATDQAAEVDSCWRVSTAPQKFATESAFFATSTGREGRKRSRTAPCSLSARRLRSVSTTGSQVKSSAASMRGTLSRFQRWEENSMAPHQQTERSGDATPG